MSKSLSNKLPWIIVAILVAALAVMASMLGTQQKQLEELNAKVASATPSFCPDPEPTGKAQPTQAQQTPPEEVKELMRSLPKRDAKDPYAIGAVDAPVVLVEWSDFRCPFCAVWAKKVLPELQPYIDSGSLRIEHRDLVLFGDQSLNVATAARAAGTQGRFWEFYHAVMDNAPTNGHPDYTDQQLIDLAKKAGIPNIDRFTADLTNEKLVEQVVAETNLGRSMGLKSTPFFVINETPISGAQPASAFIKVIESYGGKK